MMQLNVLSAISSSLHEAASLTSSSFIVSFRKIEWDVEKEILFINDLERRMFES